MQKNWQNTYLLVIIYGHGNNSVYLENIFLTSWKSQALLLLQSGKGTISFYMTMKLLYIPAKLLSGVIPHETWLNLK